MNLMVPPKYLDALQKLSIEQNDGLPWHQDVTSRSSQNNPFLTDFADCKLAHIQPRQYGTAALTCLECISSVFVIYVDSYKQPGIYL
jgi:hypothetical protein